MWKIGEIPKNTGAENRQNHKLEANRPEKKLEQPLSKSILDKIRDYSDSERPQNNGPEKKADYSRPGNFRSGLKEEVWNNAKDEHGRVRDPVTGQFMSKNKAWDMGHKPGYEFAKHQKSAEERQISREQFLNEYNEAEHYRPELPSSNRSHKGEDKTGNYFGD